MYVSEAKSLDTVQDTGVLLSPEDNIPFDLAGPGHSAPSRLVDPGSSPASPTTQPL